MTVDVARSVRKMFVSRARAGAVSRAFSAGTPEEAK